MKTDTPDPRIENFLEKYTPEIGGYFRDARLRLRKFFPRGFELVFDNYNALVFAISPTDQSSNAFISLAGYPRWITLFFLQGAILEDPTGLLEGRGKQVRSIRLKNSSDINTPEIEDLIAQAIHPYQSEFKMAPPLSTVIKSVVTKQRTRRPPA